MYEMKWQVLGKIVAPRDPNAWKKCGGFWLAFIGVQNLIMDGSGKIDGQGSLWWNVMRLVSLFPLFLHILLYKCIILFENSFV